MLTSSSPVVGAIAFGRSGTGHVIAALDADRVILKTSEGLKRVPLAAIARWEMPAVPTTPALGQRVRLKNTVLEYVVIELYDHFMGWVDGERTFEAWARLQADDSRPAHWKINQLEIVP
jgi:hypothetical protein